MTDSLTLKYFFIISFQADDIMAVLFNTSYLASNKTKSSVFIF